MMGEDIDDFDVDAVASEDADRLIFAKVIEYLLLIFCFLCASFHNYMCATHILIRENLENIEASMLNNNEHITTTVNASHHAVLF